MLVMAIYNFFIFLAIRERAYLLYVDFVMMEASYQGFHQGFTYQNLWPNNSWWHSISGGVAISLTIAFAAETENVRENALKKLKSKGVDGVIANDVSIKGLGFESDNNQVTIYSSGREVECGPYSKKKIAIKIVEWNMEQSAS